jgi:hypothetical protein
MLLVAIILATLAVIAIAAISYNNSSCIDCGGILDPAYVGTISGTNTAVEKAIHATETAHGATAASKMSH